VALEPTPAVLVERLADTLRQPAPSLGAPVGPTDGAPWPAGFSLDDHLESLESELVRRALDQVGGDRSSACQLLGITPRSLRYLIRKHHLAAAAGDKI
jgi:DNA-binding NtrC family response regulator